MKTFIFPTITLAFVLLVSSAIANLLDCTMDRADLTAVVTAERRIEAVEHFSILLASTVKAIKADPNYDNFILFVHGRGLHPCHAFDKSLITDMESDYSAKVIMFHWPSWDGILAYPDKNARRSAKDLKAVLNRLAKYQQENKKKLRDIKFTLFTHSMGSIVLEELMLEEGGEGIGKIFDTVVINAAASSGEHHAKWVEKIQLSDNIYITVNKHDPTLGKAELYEEWRYWDKGWRLLGKSLVSKQGEEYSLADNTAYIDVTEAPFRHVYYLHRYLKKSPPAKAFYDQVMNGKPAKLDGEHGVIRVEKGKVFILAKTLPKT